MNGANSRKGQSPFYGSDTIALVDLNYTLVENSPKWGSPKMGLTENLSIHTPDRRGEISPVACGFLER